MRFTRATNPYHRLPVSPNEFIIKVFLSHDFHVWSAHQDISKDNSYDRPIIRPMAVWKRTRPPFFWLASVGIVKDWWIYLQLFAFMFHYSDLWPH